MKSPTLKKMQEKERGFRVEHFRNSGVKNLKEILTFEVIDLGNEDILDYIEKQYGIKKEENVQATIDKVNIFLNSYSYGLWLTMDTTIYDIDGTGEYEEYRIPKDHMVVCDLGEEGTLFAFKIHPELLRESRKEEFYCK